MKLPEANRKTLRAFYAQRSEDSPPPACDTTTCILATYFTESTDAHRIVVWPYENPSISYLAHNGTMSHRVLTDEEDIIALAYDTFIFQIDHPPTKTELIAFLDSLPPKEQA